MPDGDRILFRDAPFEDIQDSLDALQQKETWKILIVDDGEDVFENASFMIPEFSYFGKKLQLFHAYSEFESKKIVTENPDIALILIDITLENEDSGLYLIRFIREELGNSIVRIILHGNNSGNIPSFQIIKQYDITDYKEKNEITIDKLHVIVNSALRTYDLLARQEYYKQWVKKITETSTSILEQQSLPDLSKDVLSKLSSCLRTKNRKVRGALIAGQKRSANNAEDEIIVLAATGIFEWCVNRPFMDIDNAQMIYMLEKAKNQQDGFFYEGGVASWFLKSKSVPETFLYFEMTKNFEESEHDLLMLFFVQVTMAFDNLFFHRSMDETQQEIIFHITEAMEYRSQETGSHVRRVAEYAYLLALKCGLSKKEAEMLKLASTPHDIGKIGIPDAILNKPGPLTKAEYAVIKNHVYRGYDLLISSSSPVIQMAARIILQHHERWDGKGYPLGLKGEEIHIHGRIVGVADVFDALSNKRVYHDAWGWEEVFDYFEKESGKHFDPNLVRILKESKDEFREIWTKYSDDRDTVS